LHFRRKPLVERQLQRWTAATLKDAIMAIQAALLQTRQLAALDDVVMAKTLLDLARTARR
jgi:DNA polymerase-3 subunit delta